MIVFEQVLILFVFILAGYGLSKAKILDSSHSRVLSGLLVYVFGPCLTFQTMADRFNRGNLTTHFTMIRASLLILLAVWLVGVLIARRMTDHPYQRHIYSYSLITPNFGYMGYALMEALYGKEGLFQFMIFAIPLSFYVYIVGFNTLTKRPMNLKGLLNPSVGALVLGCTAGLLELRMPSVVSEILSKSGACMAPVSMILAGMVISQFPLKNMVSNVRTYLIAALRLVILPVLIGIAAEKIFGTEVARCAILLYCLPCGLNTIVYPKLVNEDCESGASLACVTNILACITIPLVLAVFRL
jgi:predicted permease